MMNILLIEDDRGIATALSQAIAQDHQVTIAHNGGNGLKLARQETYDALILDLDLPDMSGLAVCQELRVSGDSTPILILSGEAHVLSKIRLLDAGANDYLTKPFSLGELKARLRVLRRQAPPGGVGRQQLEVGDLVLNPVKHEVRRAERIIPLRRKEFSLLECLMRNAGSMVSRTTLGNYAWAADETPWTNTIDVHIKHLRDRVDRPFATQMIKTVHGYGYKLEAAQPASIKEHKVGA